MRGYLRKKYVALLMVLVFAMPFLPAIHVGATPATRARLEELREEQRQARQAVSEQRNLLEYTQQEMSYVLQQIQMIDQEIIDATAELEVIEYMLLQTEIRLADAHLDRYAAQDDWLVHEEFFRYRLRAMHEAGPVGYLEVLFGAESFADFFMRLEDMRLIAQADREALALLESAERRERQAVDQINIELNLTRDLEHRQLALLRDLEFQANERETFFLRLYETAEYQETFLAILEESSLAIEAEFGQVYARWGAEVAEAERIRVQAARDAERARQNDRLASLNNHNGDFQWPVPTHSHISSHFGYRYHPISNRRELHRGIDIPAPAGTRIVAAADGYVRLAGHNGGFGITVIIDHFGGYSTLYAHNSRNRVTQGQRVTRGQHIADVGTTGVSTGNHLHFEIRRNGTAVNPMTYWPQR